MSAPAPSIIRNAARVVGSSRIWLLVFLFLTVTGSRLWIVQGYGTSIPFWDQWDAGGTELLVPWMEGRWTISSLFAAHNEHRIVLTRILTLGLFHCNGQWDANVEMSVNAGLCGLIAVLMTFAGWNTFPARYRLPILVASAAVFSPPFAWENTIAGFQSQFYFLLLFSLIALWGVALHAPLSRQWWLGIASLFFACLSMASGFFAAVALLGFQILQTAKQRRWPGKGGSVTAFVCLLVIVASLMIKTTVDGHSSLKADSPGAFLSAFLHCTAWPFVFTPALAIPMQLPLLVLAALYLLRPPGQWQPEVRRQVDLIFVIGLWCLLQAAAISLARGSHGIPPASRYMDLLALGAMMNFMALLVVGFEVCPARWRKPASLATGAWVALAIAGLVQLTQSSLKGDLPARAICNRLQELNVRGYVETGDFERFLANKGPLEIPYPDAGALARMLDHTTIRRILPAVVRMPLAVNSADGDFIGLPPSPASFPAPEPPLWDSRSSAGGNVAQGKFQARLNADEGLPHWKLRFSGGLGKPRTSFEIRDASGSHTIHFDPGWKATDRWQAAEIAVPSQNGPLEIIAIDTSPEVGFAFTAPVEIGTLSCKAGFLLRRGKLIFYAGVFGITGIALLMVFQKMRGGYRGRQTIAM